MDRPRGLQDTLWEAVLVNQFPAPATTWDSILCSRENGDTTWSVLQVWGEASSLLGSWILGAPVAAPALSLPLLRL